MRVHCLSYEEQKLSYFLNPCPRRTRFNSIAIKLNHSRATFSLIAIELKVGGERALRSSVNNDNLQNVHVNEFVRST